MHRRKFLALLAVIPALRVPQLWSKPLEAGYAQGHVQHKGYNIYWTGYKEAQNNDC